MAREPASSCPRPCASLKNAPRILPVHRSWLALVGGKQTVVRYRLFLRNLPVRAFNSHAQAFSTPLDRRRSSYPPPSPKLGRTHPKVCYQALRGRIVPCLSGAITSRRAPNHAPEEHHPQPTIPRLRLN